MSRILWEIHDAGNSIPDEYHEKIFQPFFQMDSARDSSRTGFGLGLYICRQIVEDHGGSLIYQKGEKRGSVFIVSLPRSLNDPAT